MFSAGRRKTRFFRRIQGFFMSNPAIRRLLAALLCAAMIAPMAACGSSGSDAPANTTAAQAGEIAETEEETEPDKFEGIDLGGVEIRIQTSIDDDDSTNANFLIEGTGAENGDVVNDAVYKRNVDIEDLLNVKLTFIESDETYSTAQSAVKKIIMSGDDVYDIIIQDLLALGPLAIEGMFLDVSDQQMIDFSQPYWWTEYMADLSLGNGSAMYIMAGDFFADILCSAHCLYLNKQQLENLTGDPNEIYNKVLDGSWTTDEFLKYIQMAYQDLNGDSAVNKGDNFGYICIGMWGSAIPLYICGDLNFVTRDEEGVPTYTLQDDPRAAQTLEMLNKVYYDSAVYTKIADIPELRSTFGAGLALFCGYQRVGDFQNFRDLEFDVGLVPYPKLDLQQEKYVTSTHDTSEAGVIPVTCSKLETTATVIEALCRETHQTVIPAYYETALKVKYARDDITSQMLDIIHDNLRVAFPIAYNTALDFNLLSNTFQVPLSKNSSDFASTMAKVAPKAQAELEKMIEAYYENIG